jgi:RNA polymerase sigma-70 factor (ECF subfamily)
MRSEHAKNVCMIELRQKDVVLMDNNKIIENIINGDKEQFSMLMNKYHNEIFKYVYNLTGNYQSTEDLTQEIFFKIYKNLTRYDYNKSSFRTWIYRISTNHTYNYLKSKRNIFNQSNVQYEDAYHGSEESVEDNVVNEDQMKQIVNSMKRLLKPKHYKIMSMHYFSNLTVKEIGESLSIPIKTIYKAISSSIAKIKKEVNVDEI